MTTVSIPDGAVLLTEAQVATMVQVQPRTIRRWVSAGQFPKGIPLSDHARSKRRWRRTDVDAWIDAKERNAG